MQPGLETTSKRTGWQSEGTHTQNDCAAWPGGFSF